MARVVRLVEEARAGKYPFAQLVDRFSAAFVPFVLALAAATFGYWTSRAGVGEGVLNSLSVLLIACPCAIGIATPLACTAAAGRAAAAGVLVRSGEAFERLARAKRAFLDKTGTLTKGELELASVTPAAGRTEASLFALAAAVEESSEHPVAVAIRREASRRGVSPVPVSAFRAFPGRGVEAVLAFGAGDGSRAEAPGNSLVRIGTPAFVGGPADCGCGANGANGTVVQVAVDGAFVGSLAFRDEVRPSARAAVAGLEAKGLAVEVLSGDRAPSVAAFAAGFPGLAASAGLLPEEKLERVRASIAAGEEPLMVGDGINDAPALSGAGIGVTLESGTDLAREVSDVTILGGDLSKLPWTVGLARRTVARGPREPLLGLPLQRNRTRARGVRPPPPALRRGRDDRLQPVRRRPLAAPVALPAPGDGSVSDTPTWAVAAALTFAASVHCVGMCGGLALAVGAARGSARWRVFAGQVLLQTGKAATYAFLGALAGAFGGALVRHPLFGWTGRILTLVAGIAIVLAGLSLLGLRSTKGGTRWAPSGSSGAGSSGRSSQSGPRASPSSSGWRWGFSPARSSMRGWRAPRRAPARSRAPRSWRGSPSGRFPRWLSSRSRDRSSRRTSGPVSHGWPASSCSSSGRSP